MSASKVTDVHVTLFHWCPDFSLKSD
jgi:hypothetical protein